jgi:hypothetical protein
MTEATLAQFLRFARTSQDEGREVALDGVTTPGEKGYITNLKKLGLVETWVCEGDPFQTLWLGFTQQGRELAASHGIAVA